MSGGPIQAETEFARQRELNQRKVDTAVQKIESLTQGIEECAAWAAQHNQWAAAFDWYDLAAAWMPGQSTFGARSSAAAQALAREDLPVRELWRVLSRWVTRSPLDPEPWDLASELFARCRVHGRALESRIRASQLRGDNSGVRVKWEEELAERLSRNNGPNVIFYNVTNSGASAIDPILREILGDEFQYDPFGTPDVSNVITPFLTGVTPFYHWTHDGPAVFEAQLARPNCKCICLYRDPRDVIVSHAMDPSHAGNWGSKSTSRVLVELAGTNFPHFFQNTRDWLALDSSKAFRFTFEEMKKDIPGLVARILDFLGLAIDRRRLATICERHSFERVTGRERGSEGPVVRTSLMARRGVSGDWRKHFDANVATTFVRHCGSFLIEWGYEKNHQWARDLEIEAFGPQPFPMVVEPPVNGFHLIRFGDRFHAVRSAAIAEQLSAASPERVRNWTHENQYFTSLSLAETRQWACAQPSRLGVCS